MKRIAYKDFLGAQKGGFLFSKVIQSAFDNAVEQANAFVEEHKLDVVTIETIWSTEYSGGCSNVRIWYRTDAQGE